MYNEIKLAAVGDIMLGDTPICMGFGVHSLSKGTGYDFLLNECRSVFTSHDLVFGNLECVLSDIPSDRHPTFSNSQLRADSTAVLALKNAGFNILSVANNHIMQHGTGAFYKTIENLDKSGIAHVGTKKDNNPTVLTVRNIKVGFMGYSLIPDRFSDASEHYSIVDDSLTIIKEIVRLRNNIDVLILSLHWGYEFMESPSPQQIELAHMLVDSGVDVLLGHHSHIVQGVERYKKALIAYSLGNFIFDSSQKQCRESIILSVTLSKAGISAIDLLPVRISKNLSPAVCSGHDATSRLYNIDKLCTEIKVAVQRDHVLYFREVARRRRRYQMQVIIHILTSIYKYPVRMFPEIVRWILSRIWWTLRLILIRNKDPYSIYR